jgi:L-lactate dehydrogenase complex protein LldG
MSSREQILARVRAGVGKGDAAARRETAEAWLAARQRGPQPVLADELIGRFMDKAVALSSSVERVDGEADVPAAVQHFLNAHDLLVEAVIAPELAALDWPSAGLAVRTAAAVDADRIGITGCYCAIAETGTLMLLSGPDSPASISLLPETHIALVPAGRIVASMEDAFAMLRAERGELPRAVNFISGPSRTGDIEQTIVLGAHGPCRVHLILIG